LSIDDTYHDRGTEPCLTTEGKIHRGKTGVIPFAVKAIRKFFKLLNGSKIAVLLISALAFVAFFGNAYFSDGFKGMLGYELKDTLAHLTAHLRAIDQASTLFWDPDYLQYTPRMPQVPLQSPVTLVLFALQKIIHFPSAKCVFVFLLFLLAVIQISCVLTMYLFIRSRGLGFMAAVLGGLCYAYNYQTFVYGIKHGYERISAVMLAPLIILAFCKFLDEKTPAPRRRLFVALTALLLGLSFIANGDVKPTFYFCMLMVIIALLTKPFRIRNVVSLLIIFGLAGGIFLVQALPTYYSLGETARGQATIASIMDFSIRPLKLLLTHISTGFTDRPDYPWESTVEFSLSLTLLVIVGLFHLSRHRMRIIILVTLGVCFLWILGKYTPLAPLLGHFMKLFALRYPPRIMVLVYFCYAFLAALGAQYLDSSRYNRWIVVGLSLVPVTVLILFLSQPGKIPVRYVVFLFLSYLVISLVSFGFLKKRFIWLIVLFFLLERVTLFSSPEESNVCDPTAFYPYDAIYTTHPRVRAIKDDPEHGDYRAFFGAKDLPDLFSFNLYLNAISDGIRPIFPYLYFSEEMLRIKKLQEVIFANWANPMWDILNVKYFVDLEGYFATWDEEDTSKVGLEHLEVVNEHVRINPGVEKEVFVRYRTELIDDNSFLREQAAGNLNVIKVAYLNDADADSMIPFEPELSEESEEISVIGRKTDEITVEVTVTRPAFVVFSEFWFFPWSVEVDGEKARLLRTYNVLQGVRIPTGRHLVRFYFNSRHWKFVLPFVVSYGVIFILLSYILLEYCRGKKYHNPIL